MDVDEAVSKLRYWREYDQFPMRIAAVDALLQAHERDRDRPELDGTDGAHPAYWRGSDAGVAGAVMRIRAALDGQDNGAGVLSDATLELVRRDVLALREAQERDREEIGRLRGVLASIRECLQDDGPGNNCYLEWHEECVVRALAALTAQPERAELSPEQQEA